MHNPASALAYEAMRRPVICLQEACTKSVAVLYSISTFSLRVVLLVLSLHFLVELSH